MRNYTGLGGRFYGAGFDGERLFFLPHGNPVYGANRTSVELDVRAKFSERSSWRAHTDRAADSNGAVFDGRYLYPVPWDNKFSRFEARTTKIPVAGGGSFF